MTTPLTLDEIERVRFPMSRRPREGYFALAVDDLVDQVLDAAAEGRDHRPIVAGAMFPQARRPNEGYRAAEVDEFLSRLRLTDPAALASQVTAPRGRCTPAPGAGGSNPTERWGVTEHRSLWQRLTGRSGSSG